MPAFVPVSHLRLSVSANCPCQPSTKDTLMAKRRLTVEFAELTNENKILRLTFNRPLSRLEADGILLRVEKDLSK